MKPLAAWMEMTVVVTGCMVLMLLVMWTQQADKGCVLSFEEPRRLVLSRDTDREHLVTDVASAGRIARRYMRSTDAPAQRTRFLECETTLRQQIATRHDVTTEDVRASASDTQN